jgi:hypothetical protein
VTAETHDPADDPVDEVDAAFAQRAAEEARAKERAAALDVFAEDGPVLQRLPEGKVLLKFVGKAELVFGPVDLPYLSAVVELLEGGR